MLKLSDCDLTSDELRTKQAILAVLWENRGNAARAAVEELAAGRHDSFFRAALSVLLHTEAEAIFRRRCALLLERPSLLAAMVDPERLSWRDAIDISRELIKVDPWLDLRLARIAPARSEDGSELNTPSILRLLDILQEISTGPRLIAVLGHLVAHSNRQVASKAALFLGRRIQNPSWTERLNRAGDARLRANAIEALWGRRTPWAHRAILSALADENNRVAGNALMGLHLLGDPDFRQRAAKMLGDPRPLFRQTAAWVMGRTGDPEFLDLLQHAVNDPESAVRGAAVRALISMRKSNESQPAATAPPAAAPALPVAPPPVPLAPAPASQDTEAPPETPAEDDGFFLHLDGSYRAAKATP
ncbi:MAG: HEAT repeat domain-containing protein [Acidobacteria bacterium]|nr:HEAT repeat domain-containing protein [Acidobacteriota bacterium]